ncbi:MAG: glycerol-3-phosphate acyltransferase, partial [Gorillibacterium sp.]|nr:glycerol-3-phosphate acyltransferase [Gorillibacterium sp.]
MIILLSTVEFLCGSFMFSYWLGQMARKDLRTVGDGNPGAFNLWSVAGFKWGMAGVVLDFMKGYLPLVLFIESGMVQGYGIVLIAAAPIVGHAFSPFLRFKGGKAIAVTFGVWSALSRFEVSLAYAIILALLLVISIIIKKDKHISTEANAFQTVFGMLLVAVYLYLRNFSSPFFCFWLINFLVLTYTNRSKLAVFL